jgi:hypothetical protein
MFIYESPPSQPKPIYGRQNSRFAPNGAWNLILVSRYYKHFAATRLFPADSDSGLLICRLLCRLVVSFLLRLEKFVRQKRTYGLATQRTQRLVQKRADIKTEHLRQGTSGCRKS